MKGSQVVNLLPTYFQIKRKCSYALALFLSLETKDAA